MGAPVGVRAKSGEPKGVTRTMQVELITDARALLGEGPVWDGLSNRLFWVDIEGGRLHALEPESSSTHVWEVGCRVGAAVPREQGGMILATEHGLELFELADSRRQLLVAPENEPPTNRFNDGKCDARGRFWAGTMSMIRTPRAGSLYLLEPDHTVRRVLSDVTTSNGLDWSEDHRTMYYIDTPTMLVRAFDFDLENGTLDHERIVIRFSEGVGRPDGMTADAEGMLWIAHWDGGRVTRWDPDTGRLLQTVSLPVARVTSCAFGGADLDTLYITTARHGLDAQQQEQQPHAGSLFALRPGVVGRPAHRYAG